MTVFDWSAPGERLRSQPLAADLRGDSHPGSTRTPGGRYRGRRHCAVEVGKQLTIPPEAKAGAVGILTEKAHRSRADPSVAKAIQDRSLERIFDYPAMAATLSC